jgi:DNA-binding transcriptional regulator YiaG
MPLLPKPSPEAVLQARKAAGLTQELAGQILGRHNREWRKWESGTGGMQDWAYELFLLKTGQHPTMTMVARPQ